MLRYAKLLSWMVNILKFWSHMLWSELIHWTYIESSQSKKLLPQYMYIFIILCEFYNKVDTTLHYLVIVFILVLPRNHTNSVYTIFFNNLDVSIIYLPVVSMLLFICKYINNIPPTPPHQQSLQFHRHNTLMLNNLCFKK